MDRPRPASTAGVADRVAVPAEIAYIVDPRFSGGTSAAVAAELRALATLGLRLRLHAIESRLFRGRYLSPPLAEACEDLKLVPEWDAPVIHGDLVLLHNPSFLRFDESLPTRIIARHLVVVTHENLSRPGGAEAFDVGKCLGMIDRRSLALRKSLAPVSSHNRETVTRWRAQNAASGAWQILPEDWFNICAFEMTPPTQTPRDRRGRHSRPGPEKFPPLETLARCFPQTAERNVVLGADALIAAGQVPKHWQAYRFNEISVRHFFDQIDFLIYFTAPTWSESFGRVLAEGIAAGKVVIANRTSAAMLPGAVVAADPHEIDGLVAAHVQDPALYRARVLSAQKLLAGFSPDAFCAYFKSLLHSLPGAGS